MSSCKGKVITVQGIVDPSSLGVVLTHEHLYAQVPFFYSPPKSSLSQKLLNAPFEMKNLYWIRQNPYTHVPNLTLYGELDAVTEELKFFKENGGGTIVENSTVGLHSDTLYLKHLSDSTGVNIVCGTGFYVETAQEDLVRSYNEEKMADKMRHDILEGVDGVRCGIIGEIGTSWPVTEFEKRSLRSSAQVQEELGCPVIIHPGRNEQAPSEVVRLFQEAGGKAEHSVMSHLDRTFFDMSTWLEFAELGSYIELDLFGTEVSYYQLNEAVDIPSDAQRIQTIKNLLDEGYEDKIVLSHDIHTRHKLIKYGGHGYSHILLNVVPKMLQRGITQDQVDKMIKFNPQKWLQFFK
ncbi:unnamed protein product [Candidula unifasciata]|uniref:Parathion hydrolase-related protein n=1 Tax=Candidula unifasciata TaxID=100452 RepID=A0A8S3ZXW9_9EUPU|nr:unnamed protein product [Candidula unifasciata]